jgi:endonuclease-8
VPEGDTIHYAANRIRPVLEEVAPEAVRTPHHRFGADRLGGRTVTSVDAHGKHLFLRFEEELTLHSHLRMTDSWGSTPNGRLWKRNPRRAWLVLETLRIDVVQFDGPAGLVGLVVRV